MTSYSTIEYRALTYYRADLDRIPPLTREEEATLVERLRLARGQGLPPEVVTATKQRLVEGMQRLVMFLALKQAPRFVRQDLEDLIQEASLALLEATERCEFVRENFSGYASYVIRRAFATAWTRDYPVSITRDVLLELAKHDCIQGNPLLSADSLDTPLEGTDDLILADTLEAPAPVSPEASEDPQKTALVESLLSGLSERQRMALRMRYGLDEMDGRARSLTEIAAHLGLSDTAASSLLKHALISCQRLADKWGIVEQEHLCLTLPPRPVAPPHHPGQPSNPFAQVKKLHQAEQVLRDQWERITAHRLAEVAHVDKHVAREYLRTHRDPAYDAQLAERAQQPLREACAQLETEGQPITVPALVRLTHLGSKVVGAFLNARAGNAQERMTSAYQQLQAEGWRTIGNRRLSQAAQVSEHRAKLFLQEQAASPAACPVPQAEPMVPTMPPAPMKGNDSVDSPTLLAAARPVAPRFLTYDLSSVLIGEVILNVEEGILTHVSDTAEFAAQACLPPQVLAVTRTLLDAHPAPCSQATLYAVWADITVEEAQEMLAALFHAGYLDLVLRGLHGVLAECRAKLSAFNLGLQPLPEEESYRLFRLSLVQ